MVRPLEVIWVAPNERLRIVSRAQRGAQATEADIEQQVKVNDQTAPKGYKWVRNRVIGDARAMTLGIAKLAGAI